MSWSTLYEIHKDKAVGVKEFRNSWGSAPIIWGYLNKRFLGGPPRMPMFGNMEPIWSLWCDPKVPEPLRAANAMTLDFSLVTPNTVERMAANLAEAHVMVTEADFEWSHFADIGKAMTEHTLSDEALGFGLSCTSVCDPWENWKGKKEDEEPWSIFESMDHILKKAAP